MRVTRFRGEDSLKELVDRLYRIDQGGPSQSAAATRLIEANRHLPLQSHDLAKAIPKGTMIAVPEIEKTRPGRTTEMLQQAAAKAALARAAAAIDQLTAALDADDERSVVELRATDELIRSKKFRAAAREDEQVAAELNGIKAAAKVELDRLDRRRQRRQGVVKRASAASEALAAVLAGATGGRIR
jgi:hypothetical protein